MGRSAARDPEREDVTAARGETAFVCLLRLVRPEAFERPSPQEESAMERHYARLKNEAQRGRVLLAGPCLDGAFGVVVLRAESLADARSFIDADPVIAEGVMTAEIHPFRISLRAAP